MGNTTGATKINGAGTAYTFGVGTVVVMIIW